MEKMRKADGIIFASPGYSHMVSGLYKNFMDRFMSLDHIPDPMLVGKPVIAISTSGMENVMKPVRYMIDNGLLWWGCNITATIGIATAMYVASEKYAGKIRKKLKEEARRFWNELHNPILARPSMKQYFSFVFNRAEDTIGGDNQPYRQHHWQTQGWTNSDYYYETRINPLWKMMGAAVTAGLKGGYSLIMGKDAIIKIDAYLEQRY